MFCETKPLIRYIFWLLLLAAAVQSQSLHHLCGLPEITATLGSDIIVRSKSFSGPVLQNQVLFKVRDPVSSTNLTEVLFEPVHSDNRFEIFAEVDELTAGRISDESLDSLVSIFRDHTYPGSIDEFAGIQTLAETIFGQPPDVDSNGKVFILLLDIRDDFNPEENHGAFVAGYFDPLDQSQQGNLADIIYLDTNPGSLSGPLADVMISTLAHEYQHLIHFGRDRYEELWVNEGLSELAPVLMGFPHREFAHYLADTNVPLEQFNQAIADYSKTGLFFLYTWVQLGTEFIQDLIRSPQTGVEGFYSILPNYFGAPDWDGFVYNWHLANFLHGEDEWGYGDMEPLPGPMMHSIITAFPVLEEDQRVKRLAARWVHVSGGADLYIHARRSGTEPALTLFRGPEKEIFQAPGLLDAGYFDPAYGSEYSDLYILATTSDDVSISAWYDLRINAKGGYSEVTISYDKDVDIQEQIFLNLESLRPGESWEAVVEFTLPAGEIELAAVAFVPTDNSAIRLRVFEGPSRVSTVIYDSGDMAPLGGVWNDHRLPAGIFTYADRIYVSVTTLDNAIAYQTADPTQYSYFRLSNELTLTPLNHLQFSEGGALDGNWSMRLTYKDSSASNGGDLPAAIGYFYPNPFWYGNEVEATTLSVYSAGNPVEIMLFNIIGQQVYHRIYAAALQVTFTWNGLDRRGRRVPSGIYFARITVGDLSENRKMILIR